MITRAIVITMLGLIVSGCSTVATHRLSQASPGIAYQLPLGKMRLRVAEDGNGLISVLLDGPLVVGDPDNRLVAQLPQSGIADNNVTVTVDPKTNLMTKVEVVSTGQLTQIATNIAKSISFLQGSDSSSGIVFFAGVYDVDDLPAAAIAASQSAVDYYQALCGSIRAPANLPFVKELKALGVQPGDDDKKFVTARLLRCRAMQLAGVDRTAVARADGSWAVSPLIQITLGAALRPDPPRAAIAANPVLNATKCSAGICYRPYKSRQINLAVRGAFALSDVFLLPDPDGLILVGLPSGAFAEQKYTLDFTDGVLTKYTRDGKSELVGLAGLPVEVVKTILSAPVEVLGLKQKKLEAQSSYLAAVDKAVEQEKATATLCAESPALCPRSAYKLIGGPVTPVTENNGPVGDSGGVVAPAQAPAPVNQPNPQNGASNGEVPNNGG